jgi:hypothetical protein
MATDFGWIANFAFFYEIAIFIIFNNLLYLVNKYKKIKPTNLKNLSFKMFVGYSIAILFSIISKYINAFYGGVPESIYDSPYVGLVGRLHGARFSFIGVIIGTMFAYELYLQIFQKKIPEITRKIVLSSGIAIIVFLGGVYIFNPETGRAVQLYEILAFFLLLAYAAIVYIPFTFRSFSLARQLKYAEGEDKYRQAVISLGGACLSFIFIFLSLILDRILLIGWGIAYSFFYFVAWIFAIIAIWLVYSGVIKPGIN